MMADEPHTRGVTPPPVAQSRTSSENGWSRARTRGRAAPLILALVAALPVFGIAWLDYVFSQSGSDSAVPSLPVVWFPGLLFIATGCVAVIGGLLMLFALLPACLLCVLAAVPCLVFAWPLGLTSGVLLLSAAGLGVYRYLLDRQTRAAERTTARADGLDGSAASRQQAAQSEVVFAWAAAIAALVMLAWYWMWVSIGDCGSPRLVLSLWFLCALLAAGAGGLLVRNRVGGRVLAAAAALIGWLAPWLADGAYLGDAWGMTVSWILPGMLAVLTAVGVGRAAGLQRLWRRSGLVVSGVVLPLLGAIVLFRVRSEWSSRLFWESPSFSGAARLLLALALVATLSAVAGSVVFCWRPRIGPALVAAAILLSLGALCVIPYDSKLRGYFLLLLLLAAGPLVAGAATQVLAVGLSRFRLRERAHRQVDEGNL